ncbi:MAG: hypothetical protein ACXWNK_16700 [Vulcanimicrobiaceae bacterium]
MLVVPLSHRFTAAPSSRKTTIEAEESTTGTAITISTIPNASAPGRIETKMTGGEMPIAKSTVYW